MINTINIPGMISDWMNMIHMTGVVDDFSPLVSDQRQSCISADDDVMNRVTASVDNDAVSRIPKTALEISSHADCPEHSVLDEDNVKDNVTSPKPLLHDLIPANCVPSSYNPSSYVGASVQRVNVSPGTSGGGSLTLNNQEGHCYPWDQDIGMINTINIPGMIPDWMDMINMQGVVDDFSPLVSDQRPPCIRADDDVINRVTASVDNDAVSRIPKTALEISFHDDCSEHSVLEEDNVKDVTSPKLLLHDLIPANCVPSSYNPSSYVGASVQLVSVSAGTSGGGSLTFNNQEVNAPGAVPESPSVLHLLPYPANTPDDDRMVAAALEVLETGDLTPLIKQELKYTIQSRRLAAGKQELTVDLTPTTPRKHRHITKEEQSRAYKRRMQNREAAQRFRQRQKDEVDRLMKKSMRLESANTTLRAEVRRLNIEKEQLLGVLHSHLHVCPMGMLTR